MKEKYYAKLLENGFRIVHENLIHSKEGFQEFDSYDEARHDLIKKMNQKIQNYLHQIEILTQPESDHCEGC